MASILDKVFWRLWICGKCREIFEGRGLKWKLISFEGVCYENAKMVIVNPFISSTEFIEHLYLQELLQQYFECIISFNFKRSRIEIKLKFDDSPVFVNDNGVKYQM